MQLTPRIKFLCFVALGVAAWAGLLLLSWRMDAGPPNYARVEEGLYVGGYVPRPPRGTTAVLNLCQHRDPYTAEAHRWEPIKDAEPTPGVEWLSGMVAFVEEQSDAGRTTYVHCRNGISRSGLVVVAYLMKKYGWGRDEALAFARQRRPGLRPHPAFMRLLLEWEKEVKGR